MLCPTCRRQLAHGAGACTTCGELAPGAEASLELVLHEGTRVPVLDTMTIGRAPGNTITLHDPSVSRVHARIVVGGDGARLEDCSTHGTFLDGRAVARPERLREGAVIELGDTELRVECPRKESEAGRTVVVRPGLSLVVPAVGAGEVAAAPGFGMRPRLRSGWALKRLEAAEGDRRYVLKDLRAGAFVRMGAAEAALFELLDGQATLPELIAEAERRFGPAGPHRLAGLLADLGERGLLAGVEAGTPAEGAPGRLQRLVAPRELTVQGVGEAFERLYRMGGFLFFTRPGRAVVGSLAVVGLLAFAYLVGSGRGTPFVVSGQLGLGGLVFLVGRFATTALHELAHGLTIVSFGRQVHRAGFKLLLVFPYVFVDTSDSWFEPRRRRLAISAAGPVCDLALGGAFAALALLLGSGGVRDACFQLAFAGYVGAFLNLNPFLDRDGYHLMVDLLREPGLRRRSREALARRLAGRARGGEGDRVERIYAIAALGWSVLGACFAILVSLRYYDRLVAIAPREVVWTVLAAFYLLMFVPVIVAVGRPLLERRRASGGSGDGGPT